MMSVTEIHLYMPFSLYCTLIFSTIGRNIMKLFSLVYHNKKYYSGFFTGKHEQSLMILKDEALSAQSRLSKAEVQVENLKQERQLLRDSEARLLKEREVFQRERHTHALLKADVEAIKTSLERVQVEQQLRTEQRLDDATRECAALRRRLQEEQDRFRDLSTNLERQVNITQERILEEKSLNQQMKAELDTSRESEQKCIKKIEELNAKLKEASTFPAHKPNISGKFSYLMMQILVCLIILEKHKSLTIHSCIYFFYFVNKLLNSVEHIILKVSRRLHHLLEGTAGLPVILYFLSKIIRVK